ncbi:hypothetical protein PILCRDRAFT_830289 [Piloderma croceum F 1598]|uniref:Uncharacterized protein n=1 Tax=Piloderma croceum (strain F 1598) TaxID=765440 RepID=A0A0C3EUK3_PILCF|nr:hypothetical protein PILCRDRAFT_830289 [Piloderma croceum F 1598]
MYIYGGAAYAQTRRARVITSQISSGMCIWHQGLRVVEGNAAVGAGMCRWCSGQTGFICYDAYLYYTTSPAVGESG